MTRDCLLDGRRDLVIHEVGVHSNVANFQVHYDVEAREFDLGSGAFATVQDREHDLGHDSAWSTEVSLPELPIEAFAGEIWRLRVAESDINGLQAASYGIEVACANCCVSRGLTRVSLVSFSAANFLRGSRLCFGSLLLNPVAKIVVHFLAQWQLFAFEKLRQFCVDELNGNCETALVLDIVTVLDGGKVVLER